MLLYVFILISTYSIVPAAIAAMLLYNKADRMYHPILLLLIIGLLNEIISTILINGGTSNAFNNNIYMFVEAQIIIWQFRRWKIFSVKNTIWHRLQVSVFILWMIEILIIGNIFEFDNYLRMYTGVLVIGLVLLMLPAIFEGVRNDYQTRTILIFCTGLLIYFSINLALEILFYSNPASVNTNAQLFWYSGCINILTNFIYLTAVLWVPRKPKLIMA